MASITRQDFRFRVQGDMDSVDITYLGSTSHLSADITKIAKGILGGLAQISVINFIGVEPPAPKGAGFLLHRSPYGVARQAFKTDIPAAFKRIALFMSLSMLKEQWEHS